MIFVNVIDAWLHFFLGKVRNLVRNFVEECRSTQEMLHAVIAVRNYTIALLLYVFLVS
jgi:hypothetical protein